MNHSYGFLRSRGRVITAIIAAAAMLFGMVFAINVARAGVGLGVAPNFPATVNVGDNNVAGSLAITNNSTGGDGLIVSLNTITLIPSCGANSGTTCTSPDLGVFSIDAAATGAGSCAANTFTVAVIDAPTGKVQFTPNSTINLNVSQTCTINFTFDVLSAPDVDSSANAGLQTIQLAEASATEVGQAGLTGGGFGTDTTTVSKASPGIQTIPSAGGPVGTVLNDTATLSGGNSPTGNVTFKLFAPSDPTCSGAAVFTEVDGSAPYATTTGYTSLVVGTYRWTADYAGDASNNAVSSGCQDEQVVITLASPSISTTPNPASGDVGVTLNDTATLSGGSSPTGNVTFKLFAPSDPTCSGAAVFEQTDGTAPYATTGGYVSLVAGTYHWTADYAGDANNSSASSGCAAEPVVINQPAGEYCSPGYWKQSQHFDSWVGYSPTDKFSAVFGESITIMWSAKGKPMPVTDPTLLQVLEANGGGVSSLARAAVGALLNASALNSSLTTAEVIDIFQDANPSGDFEAAKAQFTFPENCPLN